MKIKLGLVAATALIGFTATVANAQMNIISILRQADGQAVIVGADGKFLGRLSSNRINDDSICNPIGDHGSRIGDFSLWNTISPYGDRISDTSAYNPRAGYPPRLVAEGVNIPITKNPRIQGIDPDIIKIAMCDRN
ncbi:MAG TPA: hypothetical protein VK203_22640 [Nostocaceae cyanobacterium]|nr:hypothetical protein [Nostocaceae cyanobacterium]